MVETNAPAAEPPPHPAEQKISREESQQLCWYQSRPFLIAASIALLLQSGLLLLSLFGPGLSYRISRAVSSDLNSPQFHRTLEALANAQIFRQTQVQVLSNGENFYENELAVIRGARASINLEAYIFQKGEVTKKFVDAIAERARAGVKVNMVLDTLGSFATWDEYLKPIRDAGGKIEWYHPIRWYSWPQINNRTHRELLIVDGRIGFIGGAGFADHWLLSLKGKGRWRDTMFRVEGDAVTGLQSTFAENWLEASGNVLMGAEYFPFAAVPSQTEAMVVDSSPTAGGSTRARFLYQALLASASKEILITTPYFLPDESVRQELVRAIKERGVKVSIIVPGSHNDHLLTRRSSRRLYGDLLQAGASIHEYQTAMIHAKILIIDGVWSVVGSTNFDSRSFGINDEVNLAVSDAALAGRLKQDFYHDRSESHQISYEEWKNRPLMERGHEALGALLERQQ